MCDEVVMLVLLMVEVVVLLLLHLVMLMIMIMMNSVIGITDPNEPAAQFTNS